MNTIAILIPVYNAGPMWTEVLQSIVAQNIHITEKIVVDSGSTDDSVQQALAFGFRVISIDKHEFDHGRTRQLLVDSSKSDLCVFLTQDAILASADSLENMARVFADEQTGMAYGRQLPHRNASAIEAHARLFNYPATAHVRSLEDKERFGFKVFFCSNSFACYRRSAHIACGGFTTNSIMGEDALMGAQMLRHGFRICYAAEAGVYHSHHYGVATQFRRYFDTRVFHEQNKWLIEEFGTPSSEGWRFAKSAFSYVSKRTPWQLMRLLASLSASWMGYRTGKFFKRYPQSMNRKFSMHRNYWI